jgi:anti-sigma-K factor RskA
MKYENDELISALSAEYVLGTLRGSARDRFDRLKAKDPKVQESVWYWETQLNVMATEVKPVEPPLDIWDTIVRRLQFKASDNAPKRDNVSELPPRKSSVWQWATGFAMAASLVLAVLLFQETSSIDAPVESIAVFSNEDEQVLWSVDFTPTKLTIKATQQLTQLDDNDYQLWIVPKSGDAPISVGLLPQRGEATIEGSLALDYTEIAAMAVSLEPLGGSPTGQPTTVLFATDLILVGS